MFGDVALSRRVRATGLLFYLGAISFPSAALAALPGSQQHTVAPIVRSVANGVVNIATRAVEKVDNPLLEDPDFRRQFGIPDSAVQRETRSAGSGVIVDAQRGYVLTNAHVVKSATAIEVTTRDDRHFRAELIGRDEATDIAVLRIKGENLTSVSLGDSTAVEVGDFVLAIGNPYGLGQTVTSGIVSALGRTGLGIEGYEDFIQTDASVNPGNSGGALITFDGKLIGINTAILSRTGGNVGIGFAVPINMARAVMDQIIANGEVKRGRIGVSIQDLSPELAQALGSRRSHGAVVNMVEPSSPAARAGLKKGDMILAVDGVDVKGAAQLRNAIGLLPAGNEVDVTYERKGETMTVRLRVERQVTGNERQRSR